jgi:hypothetical protein
MYRIYTRWKQDGVNLGQKEEREMKAKHRGVGEVLFPKVDEAVAITASAGAPGSIRDVLEDHLGTGDLILSAVLDVA